MKKLYIGLSISAALILGGTACVAYAKPTVDMAKLGKYYYQSQYEARPVNPIKLPSMEVISGDKSNLKFKLNFNDYSGTISLDGLISEFATNPISGNAYYEYKPTNKNDVNTIKNYIYNGINPDNSEELSKNAKIKKQIVKYKWIGSSKNIILAKNNYVGLKYRGDNETSYNNITPMIENGKVQVEGKVELNKDLLYKNYTGYSENIHIYGIRGNGTLEVEIENIYKN